MIRSSALFDAAPFAQGIAADVVATVASPRTRSCRLAGRPSQCQGKTRHGGRGMSDPQIVALRAQLANFPRSDDYQQMRKDFDALGLGFGRAADIAIETATANGVPAEWTTTPNADRRAALLYLHGGGYIIGS